MTDVISLGVGEPDFDTPPQVIEAGRHSLASGRTHYASNYGTIELRRALAHHLERLYGVRTTYRGDPDTIGASERWTWRRATLDPGDEVVMHEPSYVSYRPAVIFAGGVPVGVATTLEEDFAWIRPGSRRQSSADQGHPAQLPCNPPAPCCAARFKTRSPYRAFATTCRSTATRSTTGWSTAAIRCGRWAGCRHAPSNRSDGRLLEGVRHDRWRIGYICAHRDPGRDSQGPPVRDHVRPTVPRTRRWRRSRPASRYRPDGRQYDGGGECWSTASRYRLRCFEPLGAFYAFPQISSTGLTSDAFARSCSARSPRRWCPQRLRRGGRGPRPLLLRDQRGGVARALVRIEHFVKRRRGEADDRAGRRRQERGAGALRRPSSGIEIHCQLKTVSKMFCGCSTRSGRGSPRTHCCPSAWACGRPPTIKQGRPVVDDSEGRRVVDRPHDPLGS